MTAIPLKGDRSAWDSRNYQRLHANDIDTSASSIHHTLGTGTYQAASGDHVHTTTSGAATDDYRNSWFGIDSLGSFIHGTTGNDNTAIGYESLYYLGYSSTGSYNTALGSESGWWIEGGSNNIFIGYNAGASNQQKLYPQNTIAIGVNSYTNKDNQIVIGNDNNTETLLKGTVIINESGSATWDFRAESDNIENMIFLDSSANMLYLGGSSVGLAISPSAVSIITNNFTVNGSPVGSQSASLKNLNDVHAPAPNDGEVLTWSASTGSWIPFSALDWKVSLTQDETANSSDKTFTVSSEREWQILWIYAEYTSTATSGARQLEIQLQDMSSNIIGQFQAGVSQVENLTYKYMFAIGVPDLTTPRDTNNITTPLPAGTFLSQGQKIRIWDNNAVDPTADDMIIRMQYASRTLRIENYYVLFVKNSSHSNISDKVTAFSQKYNLSMKNSTQAQNSSKPVLGQRTYSLFVDNTTQSQTSDNISSFPFAFSPFTDNGIQIQISTSVALTQHHILSINNTSAKITSPTVILQNV